MEKKTVRDLDVRNKKVLVRVDYNVPMDDNGAITDDTRIQASLPTVRYLLEQQAAVILMAHLGRPKGKPNPKYSLRPVAAHLSGLLGQSVAFSEDCVGPAAEEAAGKLESGQVLMLENLRYHEAEEANDDEFAEKLASLADCYVNDGFGVSHRAHASVDGVTLYLPSAAGFLLEKEIAFLGKAVTSPVRPFAAIIGGAKVSDKIGVIENLLDKVDTLLIGGGMANTFLAAEGFRMGASLVEADKLELAKTLLKKAEDRKVKMLLPVDVVEADSFSDKAAYRNVDINAIDPDWMALDIGEQSQVLFAEALANAKTIVWNGPMGVFEMDAFCGGTEAVAKAVAASSAVSIVGGGDSVAAIEKLGLADQISHISTGGGASLEYLEGKVLPGIAALDDLRLPMIAGNWKMHKTVAESLDLAKDIVSLTNGARPEVVIFPTFTALESVAAAIDGRHVGYGAQNLHWEAQGAFTGEISAPMLADIGCQYVLVGHSERRHIFGETDEVIAKKMRAALQSDLIPVLCVGETLEEREAGETDAVLTRQVDSAVAGLAAHEAATMVIAYEPVWAIGTGKTASVADAAAACNLIRRLVAKFDADAARTMRILYGGSVKPENIAPFMAEDNIDGALVGGASLEAETFARIVRY